MKKLLATIRTFWILDKEKRRARKKELLSIEYESKKKKLIMCLLCKDEAEIIEENILFHKAMGVDGIIVTDNSSTDGTRDILQKCLERGDILEIIDEPSTVFCQDKWCHRMICLAKKKYGADWVISADADEFWFSESLNLKVDILANSACNIQYVSLRNYVPLENKRCLESNKFYLRNVYPHESEMFNLGYKKTGWYKAIFKVSDYKMISNGNHDCSMKRKKFCYTEKIKIYHYYIRSFDHFKNKVIKGGEALKNYPNKRTGGHWRRWYEEYYMKNRLMEAYEDFLRREEMNRLIEIGVVGNDASVVNFMEKFVWSDRPDLKV